MSLDFCQNKLSFCRLQNHLLQQLAAISRSSIRALNEFVQHLRDFNLAEGMPRIYDNLVVLLSQIIECFDRLNSNIVAETVSARSSTFDFLIELRHFEVCYLLIEECRHLASGCATKCDCIGLMLFRYLSYVWAL